MVYGDAIGTMPSMPRLASQHPKRSLRSPCRQLLAGLLMRLCRFMSAFAPIGWQLHPLTAESDLRLASCRSSLEARIGFLLREQLDLTQLRCLFLECSLRRIELVL